MKYIYILISQTHTGFAGTIRRFGKVKYNHAAVALDEHMTELYGFARPKHHAPLLGRLVHESVFRYTLGKHSFVDAMIFRIPVTDEQYAWVEDTIHRIHSNKTYIYNLFSVLSTPITGGFSTYRAFSCIEFVMFLLRGLGYTLDKPLCRYRPDDLVGLLPEAVCYQGNLLEYTDDRAVDTDYYKLLSPKEVFASMAVLCRLFYRLLFRRLLTAYK